MKIAKNSYYEGLIQDLFCGKDGFFINFLHFFYQYNQFFAYYPKFCPLLKKLYLEELESCEVLSNLIISLGGDAKFYSSGREFLTGGRVDYLKSVAGVLEYDISLLSTAIINLQSVLLKIENGEIKVALRGLLEKKKEILKKLKDEYIELKNKN